MIPERRKGRGYFTAVLNQVNKNERTNNQGLKEKNGMVRID